MTADQAEEPGECQRCGRPGPTETVTYPIDLLTDERGSVWGEESIELCEECCRRAE